MVSEPVRAGQSEFMFFTAVSITTPLSATHAMQVLYCEKTDSAQNSAQEVALALIQPGKDSSARMIPHWASQAAGNEASWRGKRRASGEARVAARGQYALESGCRGMEGGKEGGRGTGLLAPIDSIPSSQDCITPTHRQPERGR
jgi:hypothetical protein